MSDILADLASWLPSEFLSGDVDYKPPFLKPYDFASSSSTESESDDDDVIPGLTRRFTRSVSLQERLKIPYPVEKRFFSGSPESTLNWNVSGPAHVRSSPTMPFGQQADDDAWDLFYAAAGELARMKMATVNHRGFVNRGLLRAPRPPGPLLSHNNRNCTLLSENEIFRQQLLRERVTGGVNYGGRFTTGRPVGFGQSAWPPHPVETQRVGLKPVPGGSSGGCGRAIPVVKKGCAGTGVFLPRNYSNAPPESKKNPVSPPANPPVWVVQSFNKPQANIHGVFSRHQFPPLPHQHLKCDEVEELIMAHRQNALILAQQRRSSSHDVVPETRMVQPEVVLPQEWTY